MAFENLKSTGIAYLLGKIKTFLSDTYVKIADSVKSVNEIEPDANGNIKIDTVQYAQNLESESAQRNVQTFIQRTSGGSAPIESGDGWLMLLKGNSVHEDYVAESITLTVTPAEREEGETPITATIDRDTFVAYVEDSGTTTLVYSTAWSADPTLYGITVTGTPVAGDVLTVVYVKEERGTIKVAEPSKFVSTGWNLYDSVAGYAKVVKYEYGYTITGTYTSAKYASTPTGTQIDITITDGKFNIPDDGYIIVTGGNGTDTAIFPYWTDWTDGYDGEFAVYSKDEIDLSGLFGESKPFPYGLLKIGDVADEIDLNIGVATSRIDRMAYSAENLATAQASGRAYEYDENYIYIVRASAVVTSISVDGSVSCDDHGIEYFTDTEVPVYAELLYGNNLKNKLEMNVLTISQQTLTAAQKNQVWSNLGIDELNNDISIQNVTGSTSIASLVSQTPSNSIRKYYIGSSSNLSDYPSIMSEFTNVVMVTVDKGVSTAAYVHIYADKPNGTAGEAFAYTTGDTFFWNGDLNSKFRCGYFSKTLSGSSEQIDGSVNFSPAFPTGTNPIVVCSLSDPARGATGGAPITAIGITGTSASGFNYRIKSGAVASGDIQIYWIAVAP